MATSTSLAKSASITAVESSGKSAMHSEMVRRSGTGAWIMDHGYRQLADLDHDFRAGTHARQHVSKVAHGFRFRDVDHMVGHGAITPSFLLLEACTSRR
jgi:hypothetical protein